MCQVDSKARLMRKWFWANLSKIESWPGHETSSLREIIGLTASTDSATLLELMMYRIIVVVMLNIAFFCCARFEHQHVWSGERAKWKILDSDGEKSFQLCRVWTSGWTLTKCLLDCEVSVAVSSRMCNLLITFIAWMSSHDVTLHLDRPRKIVNTWNA